jgi:membrane-associated phospholipid phosphatase
VDWLQTVDVALFRFINETLSNPLFDGLMPFASGNLFFLPAVLGLALWMVWKGGTRGRLCVLMLALIVGPGDGLICKTIKDTVARPRPYVALPDVRLPGARNRHRAEPMAAMGNQESGLGRVSGRPGYRSMPSSHAANWFAAGMICLAYYRRSWRLMLPLACLVSFSRVYNGVHYPSDVLAGAILGAGYAVAGLWAVNSLWQWIGPKWFPCWWEALPTLVTTDSRIERAAVEIPGSRKPPMDVHWLRLGYVLIGILLAVHLAYLGSGLIELTQDEAYQWIWSKHLALSYYSKPPLIAYTQFVGTWIWGDNEFGVRFFSPVIGAMLGVLVLRFFAREINARAGFFLLLVIQATPLLAAGAVLMTIDPLSVFFWAAAMISGWYAVQPGGTTRLWLWTGLWMGLGFLSKYTELFQWLCWIVLFALWKPARAHLRRPGPYLALLINLICALPVLIWNYQHDWITVSHLADRGGLREEWRFTVRYCLEFLGSEAALLNPVFFVATLWAAVAFWRRQRNDARLVFFFSMGAPLFLSYWLYTFYANVMPNWIAPAVLPLFCLMAAYWDARWRLGVRAVRLWLVAGLGIGLPLVVLLHDTRLIDRIAGKPLPPKLDPLTRARGYRQVAERVGEARMKLAAEGKPVFIIGEHYGITGLITFYLPEARTSVVSQPLVYFRSSDRPVNQFYFWPGYRERRRGENAIFVREAPMPPLVDRWLSRWWSGDARLWRHEPKTRPAPPSLLAEFDTVTDLGLCNVRYADRVYHVIQLFECRHLR